MICIFNVHFLQRIFGDFVFDGHPIVIKHGTTAARRDSDATVTQFAYAMTNYGDSRQGALDLMYLLCTKPVPIRTHS